MLPASAPLIAAIDQQARDIENSVVLDFNRVGFTSASDFGQKGMVSSWSVDRQINTDVPDSARLVSGYVAGQFTATLQGDPKSQVPTVPYWSPFGGSPAAGNHVTAPVRAQAGMWTTAASGTSSSGEQLPRFTGSMRTFDTSSTNIDITALDGMSSMKTKVTVPMTASSYFDINASGDVAGHRPNLNATWVQDYILRQNGYYSSPPPLPSCVYSATCHGSLTPDIGTLYGIPGVEPIFAYRRGTYDQTVNASASAPNDGGVVRFVATGAFGGTASAVWPIADSKVPPSQCAVPSAMVTGTGISAINTAGLLASAVDMSVNGATLTIETWLYLPPNNQIPMGVAATDLLWGVDLWTNASANPPWDTLWIRNFQVGMLANRTPVLLTAGGILASGSPAFGATGWQLCRWTLRTGPSGQLAVVFSAASTTRPTVFLATAGNTWTTPLTMISLSLYRWDAGSPELGRPPGAKTMFEAFQISTAATGNLPALYPNFKPTAWLDTSLNNLNVIPFTGDAVDSANLLQEVIQAEYGVGFFDEYGDFYFLNRNARNRAPFNTSVKTIRSSLALKNATVSESRDAIINHVTATYHTYQIQALGIIYQLASLVGIHSNSSTSFYASFDSPAVSVDVGGNGKLPYYSGAGTPVQSEYRAARTPTGGTAVTNLDVRIAVTTLGLHVTITNPNAFLAYMVSPTGTASPGEPSLWVIGRSVVDVSGGANGDNASQSADAINQTSINTYGENLFTVTDTNWTQDQDTAQSLCDDLVADGATPKALIKNVDIVGDPRLQMCDQVTVIDTAANSTKINDQLMIVGITDNYDPSSGYGQTLTLRTL